MKKSTLTLVILFFLLYVALLGIRPLAAPDETRYGEISREILASGNWVSPHLNGLRYFEKPILGHWLNALAMMVFGENSFAVRLPTALATGLTAMLLFLWARKFSNDHIVPVFTAAVFLLSFLVFGIGTFAVLDSMLSLFTMGSIVAFYFAYSEVDLRQRLILLVLAGAAGGCAFLTKGFLALVIPASVILPFALWQGWFKQCLWMVWVSVISAILVSLPWSLLIQVREPDFWHYFFWVEHVNRFISPSGGQHPQPFWYYIPILLGGAMPWTVLIGPIIQGLRQIGWQNPMIRFAICWLVFPFLFFSACGGKIATYILPCFPPLAFLIAVGIVNYLRRGKVKGFIVGARMIVCLAGLLLIASIVGLIVKPRLMASITLWQWSVVASGFIAVGVLAHLAILSPTVDRRLLLFSAAPVLLMFSMPLVATVPLKASKSPGRFLLSQSTKIPPRGIIVSRTGLAASVCWYYHRNDVFLFGSKGEYDYGLGYEGSQQRFLDLEGFKRLLSQPSERELVTLIVTANDYNLNNKFLPTPVFKEVFQDLIFAQFKVPTVAPTGPVSSPTPVRTTLADP